MSTNEPRPRNISELDLRLSEVFAVAQYRYREAVVMQSDHPDRVYLQGFVEEDLIKVPTVAYCLESRYQQHSGGYSVPEYWNVHLPEGSSPELPISMFWIRKCTPVPGTGKYSFKLYQFDHNNGSVQIGNSEEPELTDSGILVEELDPAEMDADLNDDGSGSLKVTAAVMRREMFLVEFHR